MTLPVIEIEGSGDLDALASGLNAIPTRLRSKPEQVDRTIAAGREAVRVNPPLQQASGKAQGRTGIVMAVIN
ncbi:hypothetical protein LB543_26475 [Mesorhizobium sp. ESP7-2]|uniref:hypothetical protein n=1 Tax=Mesorhizobium sp. ESP7-2 TaxID=2876622 RepID=UPI001CCC0259|nr:hypothetical protein [Mesorhizobium sp. ESP7-2]MBZ9710255.1 hypothetical protein [Mesorhizobium sp. ESP7-2]